MPDVARSDSQRSDTSLRPRVSFNRDVHVKRIVPREGGRIVAGAANGDGNGHLVPSPIRKERVKRSKNELAREAAQVLEQADKLNCVSKSRGVSPEKFYTLPTPPRKQKPNYPTASLDRKWAKRHDLDINSQVAPRKPQRTFAATATLDRNGPSQKATVFDVFKRKPDTKKSNLSRSNSDASNLKSKAFSEATDTSSSRNGKKQLSPIIEVTPREDYFSSNGDSNKENVDNNSDNVKSITEKLKEYIDEVDQELYKDSKRNEEKGETKDVGVIIIDVDKAEKISSNSKKSMLTNNLIGKKLRQIAKRKTNAKEDDIKTVNNVRHVPEKKRRAPLPPPLQSKTDSDCNKSSPKMMHSSQKPADKLPLTKGRTVDSMVRRLNNDNCLPPPKPNVMVRPNAAVQHNNNQPFSYTRGLSPEKYLPEENSRPVIYAQVVCNNGGTTKQTVHTTFNKRNTNSDSDEGLGIEDNRKFTRFGDKLDEKESPILPKYRTTGYHYEERSVYVDSSARGRADGMDAKRRESLSEQIDMDMDVKMNGRSDLSARRDLLESRINRRINDKFNRSGSSPSPIFKESPSKTYFGKSSFDVVDQMDYRSSPENKPFETSHRRYETRNVYKSTPDIYHQQQHHHQQERNESYHDSLRRERHQVIRTRNDKDRLGDSGIENDIMRRDSADNLINSRKSYADYGDSEDEGFASSLLIASERQHTEDLSRKLPRKEYDSDRAYSGEDDFYRNMENGYKNGREGREGREYAPRERSIDDGSHFDPRIDKEFPVKERSTLKRVEKKPPKPEKKSSLEKVKQLFTRDSKKKKEKHDMVREESLRARYIEYKGSREHLEPRRMKEVDEVPSDYDYSNRRRLSTPSISPTREIHTNEKSDSSYSNWFKSLDRLSRKKNKKEETKFGRTSDTSANTSMTTKRPSPKNLRFFGDTDADSSDGARLGPGTKQKSTISHKDRLRSQSTRELHNIKEELSNPELNKRKKTHKSMVNISESAKGSRLNLKPPASPNHKFGREASRIKDDKGRRKKYDFSSVESSTEGDSSQQSQRSIVYLHAATVGDIPGPGHMRNGKRASSREELDSSEPGRIQPQVKTLSRSFSVLAPWKPRHYHEANDIDYSQQSKPTKYEQKTSRNGSSRKENVSTLKKKAQDTRRSNQTSTMGRGSRSKENLAREDLSKGSSSTLYKKKERLPRENSRYNRDRDDKKMASKSMSVESLRSSNVKDSRDISRSLSMPKDPEKRAGWFKTNKPKHH